MKRNHTTNRIGQSGLSPWHRYAKRAYRYSEAYYQWFRSATGHNAAIERENDNVRAYAKVARSRI